MKTLYYVTARNMKLFFKDKGMFFTSLITPLILLVLFFTFLGNVYRDTFLSFVPDGVQVPAARADGSATPKIGTGYSPAIACRAVASAVLQAIMIALISNCSKNWMSCRAYFVMVSADRVP